MIRLSIKDIEGQRNAVFVAFTSEVVLNNRYKEEGQVRTVMLKQHRWSGDDGFTGGMVDKDETLEQAVLRELKEETGFSSENINIANLQYVCTHNIGSINTILYQYKTDIDTLKNIMKSTIDADDFIFENGGCSIQILECFEKKGKYVSLNTWMESKLASSVKEEVAILALNDKNISEKGKEIIKQTLGTQEGLLIGYEDKSFKNTNNLKTSIVQTLDDFFQKSRGHDKDLNGAVHPILGAMLLLEDDNFNKEERYLLSKYFMYHDTLEDTKGQVPKDIKDFVEEYLTISSDMSSEDEYNYLKANQDKMPKELWLLKCCDKLINLSSEQYFIKKGMLSKYHKFLRYYTKQAETYYPHSFIVTLAKGYLLCKVSGDYFYGI